MPLRTWLPTTATTPAASSPQIVGSGGSVSSAIRSSQRFTTSRRSGTMPAALTSTSTSVGLTSGTGIVSSWNGSPTACRRAARIHFAIAVPPLPTAAVLRRTALLHQLPVAVLDPHEHACALVDAGVVGRRHRVDAVRADDLLRS